MLLFSIAFFITPFQLERMPIKGNNQELWKLFRTNQISGDLTDVTPLRIMLGFGFSESLNAFTDVGKSSYFCHCLLIIRSFHQLTSLCLTSYIMHFEGLPKPVPWSWVKLAILGETAVRWYRRKHRFSGIHATARQW